MVETKNKSEGMGNRLKFCVISESRKFYEGTGVVKDACNWLAQVSGESKKRGSQGRYWTTETKKKKTKDAS